MVKKYKRVLSIFLTLMMVFTCVTLNVVGAVGCGNLGGGILKLPELCGII